MRQAITTIVELAGAAAVVHGFYLVAPFAGWIVAGVMLMAAGVALDAPRGDR